MLSNSLTKLLPPNELVWNEDDPEPCDAPVDDAEDDFQQIERSKKRAPWVVGDFRGEKSKKRKENPVKGLKAMKAMKLLPPNELVWNEEDLEPCDAPVDDAEDDFQQIERSKKRAPWHP